MAKGGYRGGMPMGGMNQMQMMKQAQKMQENLMKMQEELNSMDMNHSPNSIQEKENKQNILKQLQKEKFYYSIQLFQKTSYYKTIQELKQKRRIEEKVFTSGERGLLWDCIYQIFSDTMSYLKAQCPELTREDLLYHRVRDKNGRPAAARPLCAAHDPQ